MSKKIITILVLIFLMTSLSSGQTIHKKDLDYFIGCFPKIDTSGRRTIDCSEFVEWRIAEPDSGSQKRNFNGISYSKDKHWVYRWDRVTEQDGDVKSNHYYRGFDKLKFYILMDFSGHGNKINVLTVWEEVGHDSLRYYCGQVGPFGSGPGSVKVEYVNVFPDSSLLLVVKGRSEKSDGYRFCRGKSPCNFKKFYNKAWRSPLGDEYGRFTKTYYNFEELVGPLYQIAEVTEYIDIILQIDYYQKTTLVKSIDSADVKIINLWEMANDSLDE